MIVEHEILEQLLAGPWPLDRVIRFLDDQGADPWLIVASHLVDGNVVFVDESYVSVPKWRSDEIVRDQDSSSSISVACTEAGERLVT